MSRPLSDKIIKERSTKNHEHSDSESVIGSRPEEECCSDSEVISNCEDTVSLDLLNDNQDVDSDTDASSSGSKNENVAGPSQSSSYGNYGNWELWEK
ncbi:unnamed protein product [Parnassius apollo]|uniref:(apollo) hypothetical protein n=1 Tax=Parnassius apollo TaxID=110799 RepID=A0A8S3WE83_PARAO|nr:unnamed protein product [Parnassius apollo]